jgi:hypothetical protein
MNYIRVDTNGGQSNGVDFGGNRFDNPSTVRVLL